MAKPFYFLNFSPGGGSSSGAVAGPRPKRAYTHGIASHPLVPTVRPAVVVYQQELDAVVVGPGTVPASLVVVVPRETDAIAFVFAYKVVVLVVGDGFQQQSTSSLQVVSAYHRVGRGGRTTKTGRSPPPRPAIVPGGPVPPPRPPFPRRAPPPPAAAMATPPPLADE